MTQSQDPIKQIIQKGESKKKKTKEYTFLGQKIEIKGIGGLAKLRMGELEAELESGNLDKQSENIARFQLLYNSGTVDLDELSFEDIAYLIENHDEEFFELISEIHELSDLKRKDDSEKK